jgi:hypothetical protein
MKEAGRCALCAARALRCRATPELGDCAKAKALARRARDSELPAPPPPTWMGHSDASALSAWRNYISELCRQVKPLTYPADTLPLLRCSPWRR